MAWSVDFNLTLQVDWSSTPKAVKYEEQYVEINPELNRELVQVKHGLFCRNGTTQNEVGTSVLNSLKWFQFGHR